jgi:RNA polymerase sigma factor (TIGR02999 family)
LEELDRRSSKDVTQLLHALRAGDRRALDELLPRVYGELREIARRQLAREHGARTLEATALVHEAYGKLLGGEVEWQDRAHFLAVAARAMRQVLVDAARERQAAKRGGGWERVSFSGVEPGLEMPVEELLALDAALDRLDALDPRLRQVVELRFFAGMSSAETAGALDVTERTVQRDWIKARAWLYKEIYPER